MPVKWAKRGQTLPPDIKAIASFLILSAAITTPFAIWQRSWVEWGNAYWLLVKAHESFDNGALLQLFLENDSSGPFYLNYVFYAGPTFTLLAPIAHLLGDWATFLLSIAVAFLLFMLGTWLLVTALGVGSKFSALLAWTTAMAPYIITNLYGRGSWAELLGTASGWFLIGVLTHAVSARAPIGTMSFLAATFGGFLVAGTHNISLLLMTLFGICVLFALWPLVTPQSALQRRTRNRNMAIVAIGTLLGVGTTSYWLIPNLSLGGSTQIKDWYLFDATAAFDRLAVILRPWLYYPVEQRIAMTPAYGVGYTERLFNQTLSIVLAVALIIIVKEWAQRNGGARWTKSTVYLSVIISLSLVAMSWTAAWKHAPSILQSIQFAYRLNTYLTLSIVVLASLAFLRANKFARGLLIISCAYYIGLGAYQVASAAAAGPTWLPHADHGAIGRSAPAPAFGASSAPSNQFFLKPQVALPKPSNSVVIGFDGQMVSGTLESRRVTGTNANCSPLVGPAPGITLLGADESGKCVISGVPDGHEVLVVAWPWQRLLGAAVSLCALACIALLAVLGSLLTSKRH